MRSNPTCQHTRTRGYQGTVLIHGSLGTEAQQLTSAIHQFNVPRTLSGPPPPVQDMVLGTPSPYPSCWRDGMMTSNVTLVAPGWSPSMV